MGTIELQVKSHARILLNSDRYYAPSDVCGLGWSALILFEQPPADIINKKITSCDLRLCCSEDSPAAATQYIWVKALSSPFDPSTVVGLDVQTLDGTVSSAVYLSSPTYDDILLYFPADKDTLSYTAMINALKFGFLVDSSDYVTFYINGPSKEAYLVITYDDEDVVTPSVELSEPLADAFLPTAMDNFFSARLRADLSFASAFAMDAWLEWSTEIEDEIGQVEMKYDKYRVGAAAAAYSVTVQPGVFHGETVRWRVALSLSDGSSIYSEWQTNGTIYPIFTYRSPSDGSFINRLLKSTFSWKLVSPSKPDVTWGDTIYPKKSTLRWREKGESNIAELTLAEDETRCSIPANTFSSGIFEWQVEAETQEGITVVSDWLSFSTIETPSAAAIIAPANQVVDGSREITFSWQHKISTGTAPSGFDLQTSGDGSEWLTIRSETSANTQTTLPPGTFLAGTVYWRVRTYNSDNVAGSWSEPAQFIVIAAPAAPSVSITDESPRFSIQWAQSGQQAYEIAVDGKTVKKQFSLESTYRHKEFLSNGTHTISVRIQNEFALWSDWTTVALSVSNDAPGSVVLHANCTDVVSLSWYATSPADVFYIYRDGVKIGKTSATYYVDQFAVGSAEYEVKGVIDQSGNYLPSNPVLATVEIRTLVIAAAENPSWISLGLSTSSLRSVSHTKSHAVTYVHYTGESLPSVELGDAVDITYQLDCAWPITQLSKANEFEALSGKVVCIKTPTNRKVFGVLGQLSVSENRFIVSYSVPITAIAWEEDDDD